MKLEFGWVPVLDISHFMCEIDILTLEKKCAKNGYMKPYLSR